jgi:hypothetical protein
VAGTPSSSKICIGGREPIAVAKQVCLFEQLDGYRYLVFGTNTTGGKVQPCRPGSSPGSAPARTPAWPGCPDWTTQVNTAWCHGVAIGIDLSAWTRLSTLGGDLAKAEPGTLRYLFLHVGARIVRGGRRRHPKIPTTWPWADELAAEYMGVTTIPAPT